LFSTATFNVFIITAVIFSIVQLLYTQNFQEINLKIFYCPSILFFLLVLSISYTSADAESVRNVFFKYLKLLYFPFLYYIINSKNIVENIFRSFHIGAAIILFLSYCKYVNLFDPEIITNSLNLHYTDKLRNGATLFQHSIIHGVIFSFIGVSSYLKASTSNINYYYLFSVLCFSNVLLINTSRTGYMITLSLIALIIIRELSNTRFKIEIVALIFSIITLFFVYSDTIQNRIHAAYSDINLIQDDYYNTSLGYRYLWLQNGINNLQEKPLLGHGIGSYKNTIQRYIKDHEIQHEDLSAVGNNTHNEFISISSQIGIVGLSVFITFLLNLLSIARGNFLLKSIFIIVFITSLFNSLFFENVSGLFAVIIIILGLRNKEYNYLK